MANANWSNPQLTSTYTNFVSEVKNRDEDLALQFDGTTSTNIPTNTIRWDSTANRWKKWNGTSWAELTSTYALTGLSTTGAASIGTTLGVTGAITGSSTVTGTALIPSGSSVPVNGIYLPSANSVAISTNSNQRLAIDSSGNITIPSGNVGVGTATAPGSNGKGIALYDASFPRLSFRNSTTGDANTDGTQMLMNGNNFIISNVENGYISFEANNAERLRITSSGAFNFVGAGTPGFSQAVSFSGSAPSYSLTVDSSGNTGIGVTPSAWGGGYRAIQMTGGASLGSHPTVPVAYLNANTYYDGTGNKYIASGYYASRFVSDGSAGGFAWQIAPTGTAGNAISYTQAMTLDASGRLGIGMTPASGTVVDILSTSNTSLTSALRVNSNNLAVSTSLAYDGLAGTGQVTVQAGASSALIFGSNAGEKARIDSSGNVGIGGAPNAWGANFKGLQLAPWTTLYGNNNNGSLGLSVNSYIAGSGGGTSTYIGTGAATSYVQNAGSHYWYNAPSGTAGTAITFTQAMTLTSGGFTKHADDGAYIGASASYHEFNSSVNNDVLKVRATNASYTSACIATSTTIAAGTASYFFYGTANAVNTFQVLNNGNVKNTNNSYTAISDQKLKENITDAKSQWADIKALRIVNFKFKEETGLETYKQIGLIAQEVEAISPGLVDETPEFKEVEVETEVEKTRPKLDDDGKPVLDEDGNETTETYTEIETSTERQLTGETIKGVKYSILYMKAIKALQEAMQRIERLEAKVTALEAN